MQTKKSLLLLAAAAALIAPAAHAGTVTFSPSTQSLLLGNQATVDITVQGLGNGVTPALAAFDLTVFFDSSILSPLSVAFTSRLGDPNSISDTLNGNSYVFSGPSVVGINLINISFLDATTLYALQTAGPGGFSIATLTFNTIAAGTSNMSIFVGSSSDEYANDLELVGGIGSIDVTSSSSSVPEPASIALGGAGLLLIGYIRRFRRA